MNKTVLAAAVAAAALLLGASSASATASQAWRADFDASTVGPVTKTVTGHLTVEQTASNKTRVVGAVSGLAPYGLFVAVPYTDHNCTPLPGVTAFPSGAFFTDVTGHAHVDVTVNPRSINGLASFQASQTRSVSIRRVILQSPTNPVTVPGLPKLPLGYTAPSGVPTVPNVVYVEACDKHLTAVR